MTTYSGPKLPCTSPAWWTEARPVALPMASASSSAPRSGPPSETSFQQRPARHVLADQVGVVCRRRPHRAIRAAQNGGTRRPPRPRRRTGPVGRRVPRPARRAAAGPPPRCPSGAGHEERARSRACPRSARPAGTGRPARGRSARSGVTLGTVSSAWPGMSGTDEWFVPYALCAAQLSRIGLSYSLVRRRYRRRSATGANGLESRGTERIRRGPAARHAHVSGRW